LSGKKVPTKACKDLNSKGWIWLNLFHEGVEQIYLLFHEVLNPIMDSFKNFKNLWFKTKFNSLIFEKNLTVFGTFFGPLLMGLFFAKKIKKIYQTVEN